MGVIDSERDEQRAEQTADIKELLGMVGGLRDTAQRLDSMAHDLETTTHHLETRVAVLETRVGGQDDRLARIETGLDKTREAVEAMLKSLNTHINQEGKDSKKMLGGIIATLIGVIVTFAFLFLEYTGT